MFNARFFCAVLAIFAIGSCTFAEFNITSIVAKTGLKTDTEDYSAVISDPNVTLSNGTAAPSAGGAAVIAAYGTTPGSSGDFVLQATISNNGGNSLCGLIGNFDMAVYSGYYFDFNYLNGKAYILKITNGDSETEPLAETTTSYDTSSSYILEYRYDGTITCNIYDASHTFLESLTSSDSTYTGSSSGVMAYTTLEWAGDDSVTGSFTNYSIIPEPATIALLAAGWAGFIARKRKR